MRLFISLALLVALLKPNISVGQDWSRKHSIKLSPSDYLLKDRGDRSDPIFENRPTIELGANLGIGSDCGKVNFSSTLKATLKNLLGSKKYFEKVGMDILAASPMLLTCYFSPTWCSILKSTRMDANFLSSMRLDQCALIDKYTDSRTDDFYRERQECVHKAIQQNGGNMEEAMQECKNGNVWKYNLSDWAGNGGRKVSENKLLESSAKWAGIKGSEGEKTLNLLKSLVGETIISKGRVSVDYGPKKFGITPRTHFLGLKKVTHELLCEKLLKKVEAKGTAQSFSKTVTDEELKEISGDSKSLLLDRQTVRSIAFMPYHKRKMICRKLSSAIATTRFASEMNKTLDVLHLAAQNPNLPEKRKKEVIQKRNSLHESVKLTMELYEQKNSPLNKVLSQINEQGIKLIDEATKESLGGDVNSLNQRKVESLFWDCADGIMCKQGGR